MTANNLVPEPEFIDLTKEGAHVNNWVLGELADRSVKGQNLFNDLPDMISEVKSRYPQYIRDTTQVDS